MKIKSLFYDLKHLLKISIKIFPISYVLLIILFVLLILKVGWYTESGKLIISIILAFIISCISPFSFIHTKIKHKSNLNILFQLWSIVLWWIYYLIITKFDIADLIYLLWFLFIWIVLLFVIIVHHICMRITVQESFSKMLQWDVLLNDELGVLEKDINKKDSKSRDVIKQNILNSKSIYEFVESWDKTFLKLKDNKNIEFNKKLWWELYDRKSDWDERSDMAEYDWVKYADWKLSIVEAFINPYIWSNKNILEIAVWHGRWTYFLLQSYKSYFWIDISSECIDFCKKKYSSYNNCKFILWNGVNLETIESWTIDFVFSFDSFVHISQDVFVWYITEISRILSHNWICIIHHSWVENNDQIKTKWLRASCCKDLVYNHARKNWLLVVESLKEWWKDNKYSVNNCNDTISIFKKN